MSTRHLTIAVFIVAAFFALASPSEAVETEKIVSSAETVVATWDDLLQKGIILVYKDGNEWFARKFIGISTVKYDVKKTDSLISPFVLLIAFSAKMIDNQLGPRANGHYSPTLKKNVNYKTAMEARTNTSADDDDLRLKYQYLIRYSYKKGKWILTGGNRTYNNVLNRGSFLLDENKKFVNRINSFDIQ